MLNPTIVPTPHIMEYSKDENGKILSCCIQNSIACKEPAFFTAISAFRQYFLKLNNISFNDREGGIIFLSDNSLKKNSYKIIVSEVITVSAADPQGCLYACSSLLQLLTCAYGKILCPVIEISDSPETEHRGLMIDLGRHFHPFNSLLRYIDLCFAYKINYLHLHFADDIIFTLPTKTLPKLTVPGKSYTREQIAILTEYANDRGVEIIPEIEVPGHGKPLAVNYPELFGLDRQDKTPLSVLCLCRDSSMHAVEQLIDEVIEMFPYSKYIHFGGDEADIDFWKECSVCQRYMQENNIPSVKALYSHLIYKISNYILSKNKKPLVWEGFPPENSEKISRDLTVCEFESLYFLPNKIAEAGFTMINCSWQPLYVTEWRHWDIPDILSWNLYRFENFWSNSAAYLNPIDVSDKTKVAGAQLCVWEMTYDKELSLVKANLSALSERTWTIRRKVSTQDFMQNYETKLRPIVDKLMQDFDDCPEK